jgi:hypothetical protein
MKTSNDRFSRPIACLELATSRNEKRLAVTSHELVE